MGTAQKLGIKVFYFHLSKRIFIGFVLLIASLIFFLLRNFAISKLAFLLPLRAATTAIAYLIGGLFIISIFFIVGAFILSWFDYISCTFTLDENSFNIKRGIFSKKEVFIPYRQVQDIDIEQTFFNKMMGVSKLVILTAGNDNNDKEGESEGVFEVIDSRVAEKMRKDILQRTNVQATKEMI